MTRKLGEILVDGQALSPADLKKALDAQMIFGGRLGTNLLDLGYLDEKTLAAALQEQKRVPVATQQMFEKASKEALRLVPARVADRHKVIPLEVQDKKMKVAMLDPTDLIALDELQFMTSCAVVPYIAPEVRLLAFLERYYNIPLPLRYIKLAQLDEVPRREPTSTTTGEMKAFDPSRAARPETASPAAAPDAPVVSLEDLLGDEPAPPPAASSSRGTEPGSGPATTAPAPPDLSPVTFAEAARLLADAETRDDVGDALVAFAQEMFTRVMTFVVQKDRALGWLAHLPGHTPPRARQVVRAVVVPLEQPSVLQTVVMTEQYYMGELPPRPGDELLAGALGPPRPVNLLVLPVKLHDKVVICLYADNADKPLTGFDMRALRSLCQKASLAMEVLLLKSRIRQVN